MTGNRNRAVAAAMDVAAALGLTVDDAIVLQESNSSLCACCRATFLRGSRGSASSAGRGSTRLPRWT